MKKQKQKILTRKFPKNNIKFPNLRLYVKDAKPNEEFSIFSFTLHPGIVNQLSELYWNAKVLPADIPEGEDVVDIHINGRLLR